MPIRARLSAALISVAEAACGVATFIFGNKKNGEKLETSIVLSPSFTYLNVFAY